MPRPSKHARDDLHLGEQVGRAATVAPADVTVAFPRTHRGTAKGSRPTSRLAELISAATYSVAKAFPGPPGWRSPEAQSVWTREWIPAATSPSDRESGISLPPHRRCRKRRNPFHCVEGRTGRRTASARGRLDPFSLGKAEAGSFTKPPLARDRAGEPVAEA